MDRTLLGRWAPKSDTMVDKWLPEANDPEHVARFASRAQFEAVCIFLQHCTLAELPPELDREQMGAHLARRLLQTLPGELCGALIRHATEFCENPPTLRY